MELQDRISLWLKKYLEDNDLKSLVIGANTLNPTLYTTLKKGGVALIFHI